MKGYKACGHYLYIRLIQVEEEVKSSGGIIVRQGDTKREQKGATYAEVINIGSDCWDFASEAWCKVGDTINFAKYGGQDCDIPDDVTQEEKQELSLWKVIRDTDVLGVKDD
jgi:co-chaperonin GroES (HSP10)